MENHVKMLITEQAAEFHREDAKILNDYGFDLHFCQKDGIQVLNAINEVNPDVVVLDLFMPSMDGIGVVASAMEKPGKHPMFIVLSNFDSSVLEKEVMSAGASYFRVKALQRQGARLKDSPFKRLLPAFRRRQACGFPFHTGSKHRNSGDRYSSSNRSSSSYQGLSLS